MVVWGVGKGPDGRESRGDFLGGWKYSEHYCRANYTKVIYTLIKTHKIALLV